MPNDLSNQSNGASVFHGQSGPGVRFITSATHVTHPTPATQVTHPTPPTATQFVSNIL